MVHGHLTSSRLSSSFSSAPGPSSSESSRGDPMSLRPPPPSQPVKRRRYARRSCLTCRSKKTRCELPDEAVASSHDPLPVYKACHRCRALDILCVVWDGDRKRKPRINPASSARPPPAHFYSYNHGLYSSPHPPPDPHSLDEAPRSDRSHPLPSRSSHRDRQLDVGNVRPASPRRWQSPSISSLGSIGTNDLSPRRAADLYERSRNAPNLSMTSSSSNAYRHFAKTPAVPPTSSRPPTSDEPSLTSASEGRYDAALFISSSSSESIKMKVTGHQFPLLTNRFMHSPLSTLNRFITKIPSFSRLLRPEMDRSVGVELSSLLTDENINELQAYLPRLRIWHPHLPNLASLCITSGGRSTPSTSLLLATICLVTSKIAGKRHLAKHFAVHVDRIGLQVLIAAPKELHAAQAFELLLSHEASLIGASVDTLDTGAGPTHSAVFGESLHSSAISIAESLGLDLAMSQTLHTGDNPAQAPSEQDEQLRYYLRRFTLWCSLSIWRAKFIFLNAVVRPIDFSRLRCDAELAVSMVDKLAAKPGDPAMNDVSFRAGVLALAYRAIQLADFHTRLSQLDTLWNNRSLYSEVDIRTEIRSRFDQSLEFLEDLKNTKRRKLWSIADLPELRFLDRWIDLEFGSDWVFLFTLYMRMVLPLPTSKGAATVVDVSHSIGQDSGLFSFLWDASQRSFLVDERVIAGLAATPRFEGDNLEQTGLPLLLTCGYILHITICLMEASGFAQYGMHDLAMRVDMFAHLLPQLSARICGPERSREESLEKLVSSMLAQMAKRLNELEFYKVTQNTKQRPPSSASTARVVSSVRSSDDHRHPPNNQMEESAHRSDSAHEPLPQLHRTASTGPTVIQSASVPSTNWADASDIDSLGGTKPAPSDSSISGSQPRPVTSHDDADFSDVGNSCPRAPAAVPFPTNVESILSSSDAWSSDNMARIMDQILSWDYDMPGIPLATGSDA